MNKTTLLRGTCAVLFSTVAAVAMAQGTSSGTPTSDAGDRGSKSATGKSSNDADTSSDRMSEHKDGKSMKDKSMKDKSDRQHSTNKGKDATQAPAKGSGNADTNAPVTNKPSTQP